MTERKTLFIQGNGTTPTHSAEDTRLLASALLGGQSYDAVSPAVGAIARGHGVIGPGSLLVTPNGTPNDTVHVAAGIVGVRGTQENDQGIYVTGNDADKVLTIAASTTNPRNDLVIAQIRDNQYPTFTQDDWLVTTVTGTPAGVPVDPAVPEDALVLARLRVPTGVSAVISGAEIDDLRPRITATGGITPVAALSAWPGPQQGDVLWRTDVDRLAVRTATAWRHIAPSYIAAGTVSVTGGVTSRVVTVNFGVTFAAAPTLTVTVRAATGQAIGGTVKAGPSTTSADVEVWAVSGNIAGNPNLDWIAVGPLAA